MEFPAFLPFRQFLNSTEVALTLLLVVLFSSTLFGSRAGLSSALAGIASFNFFFLPPFYTLSITGPENWVAFGAFIITAVIAGHGQLFLAKEGDTIVDHDVRYVVGKVSADNVELTDRRDDSVHRLALK